MSNEREEQLDSNNFANEQLSMNELLQNNQQNGLNNLSKDLEGNVLKNIDRIIHESMIPYSEFVILDRALPRVEDGLKPVQRRILYSMYKLGITPDKPFRKSAYIVGEVMGKLHPHGDSSIYNAMVRLAQNFNMRDVLVDGHGNYGSEDGDSAAAMRYTEARLAPLALEMLKDLEKDTVRWSKNYDDTLEEPDILPCKFPNILVNGASGIAVGLATNIPPHNLSETIDACVALIDDENMSLDKLMTIVRGPDFPTGAIILGIDGIKQAYETGKGKLILRAKTSIEKEKGDKQNIVVTEFPFQINKSVLLQNISSLKEKHKELLNGIAEIRDESDRNGTRAVICLKKGADADAILNFLLKYTELQTSFSINMVVIANGKPIQMGLKEILYFYINHQRDVLVNRTKFDLFANTERAHILNGLLIAINQIDQIIKTIKKSAGTVEAKVNLMKKFELSEKQAQAILDMRLARLTNLEVVSIEEELKIVNQLISNLTAILNSKKLQMQTIKQEMLAIKKAFGSARRTLIISDDKKFEIKEINLKSVSDVYVCYSERNSIKVIPEKNFNISSRAITKTSTLNEVHSQIVKTKSNSELFLFSNFGNCYRLNVEDILEARWKDRGILLKDMILSYSSNEKIVAMYSFDKMPKHNLIFVTKSGLIKSCNWSEFDVKKQVFNATKLKEDDEIVSVVEMAKEKTMLFVTKLGMALNVQVSDLTSQSRNSMGVKGVSLYDGDECLFADLIDNESVVILCTDMGFVKKQQTAEIGVSNRNRKGIKITSLNKDVGNNLMFVSLVKDTFELFALDEKEKMYSIKTDDVKIESRIAKGKNLSDNKKGVKLKNVYRYLWNLN